MQYIDPSAFENPDLYIAWSKAGLGVLHGFTDSVIRERKEAYIEEGEEEEGGIGTKKRMPFLGNYTTVSNAKLFKNVKCNLIFFAYKKMCVKRVKKACFSKISFFGQIGL